MSQLEEVLSKLHKKRPSDKNYICPCHDDKVASLSIKEVEGKILLHCFARCPPEEIVESIGLTMSDLFLDKLENKPPVITDTYDYTDAEGNLLYQVVRYSPKNFMQRRPDGNGGWLWGRHGIIPTLYHLPELIDAIREDRLIFIVEGEKDANNLRKNGQVATTISGGVAIKWHPSLVPLFDGARVVIIPDNDEAGRKYSKYVADLLYGWCASLKIISLNGDI